MSKRAAQAFYEELTRVCDYFEDEFNLSYAEAVGALTIKANQLMNQMNRQLADDNDTPSGEGGRGEGR